MASDSEFNYLSLDITERYEDLGITTDDFILFQKFFLPNSNIKQYFKDNVSNVVDYDRTTSNIVHGIQHITVDPVPFVNQFQVSSGSHHGLMKHEDKDILDNLHSILTGGSGSQTSIGSTLIGDYNDKFLVKIHKRMFIGGSDEDLPDFNDEELWKENLVPNLGLYVRGQIKTGTGIEAPTVDITGNLTVAGELTVNGIKILSSSLIPNSIIMEEDGNIFANNIYASNLHSGLIKIHEHYIDHIGDSINDFIITRINDSSGGGSTTKTHNALVVSENLVAPQEGGKVFINVPKENNQNVTWYSYLSNIHPTDSTLWVGGKTTIGVPGNTIATLNLHGGGIISHEHTTFEILHGFKSYFAPNYPSMKIDSTGGLKLQSDPDIAIWAELQVGSLNNKVGQKLFGQLRINASTIMPSTPVDAVGEYALAFVTEGAGGESITGIPIAIRNDSFVGIGTLPSTKRLTVHGGADFINYSESSEHISIVSASTFENPGNILDLTSYPPSTNSYYGNNGTLLLKGTNQFEEDEDTIGYKYDLRLSGNKSDFINLDNTVTNVGKYWGTRIDGRLHLYDESNKIYSSMNDSGLEFFQNAGITLLNGSFKTSKGDFITDEGNFQTLKGDFLASEGDIILSNGSLKLFGGRILLNSYIGGSESGRFGIDTDGNFRGLSFTIPGYIDAENPLVLFGIDAFGNVNLTDLNIYGDFSFKKKTNLDLFGGNLLNIHDVKGYVTPLEDGGDGKYGNITGYHQINSNSNAIDSTPEKTSLISGFYTIKGGSSYIDESVVGDNLLIGRITGFPYIIGNKDHDGIIKQFKDIEGNFNKLDFGDASKAGDIKYYKNIIGFDFTNKDSIPFTIPNPSYIDAETTPNIPQTILNPVYPLYEGGNVKYFQNIQGISDLYHQGSIKDFDEIHTQSAVFSKGESYIYSSLFEIGERSNSTVLNQQINALSRTILFKGGNQNSKTHLPVSFQFFPNIINNPDYSELNNTVPEYLMRSYFSLHHSNASGNLFFPDEEYSDSPYVDLKVKHIWLDGEELIISASQLNDGFSGGFYSLQGTTPMQADAPIGGYNLIDVNELQVDYIKNRNTTINDITIVPNEGDDAYSIGRTIIGETKKKNTLMISSYNDNGLFNSKLSNVDGDPLHPSVIDNRSIIIPGLEEVPTRLSLMYRDYNGNIQQGISINPDGTVTLPDNPLGFTLSGDLGFMPVSTGKAHIGLLNILGLTMDSLNVENTLLGTLIIAPSTEEGEPILTFNTVTEGIGTTEDPEFKFVSLSTLGSLLFKTGSNQKIKFDTSVVEIAESGELHFNEKAKIWYDYSKNNFNFGNYILNPLNTNFSEEDDDLSIPKVWQEGVSIFYDQIGSYNETYDFNSLRVGIGTTEAYKKEGLKTYSSVGDNVILQYGNQSTPSQFLSDYLQNNVIISYQNVGNKNDFPSIKKGSLISYEGIDYQIQIVTHIDDTYSIITLNQSLPEAPTSANVGTAPAISRHEWQHKFTDIATLTVNGLLKADNISLSSGFSGQALFDQIEVGVDSYLDKAFLKVGRYDSNASISNEAFIIGAGDEPDTDRDLILISKNGNIILGDGYIGNFTFDNTSRRILGYDSNNSLNFQLGENNSSGVLALYNSSNSLGVYLTGDEADNYISNNSFDIKSHDRTLEIGLKLAGQLVESSASELNYLSEVVAGTTTFGKALVIGSDGSIDTLNTSELKLDSVLITSSAKELNILTGLNLDTDFTLIYKYLNGVSEGNPVAKKAVIMGADNSLQSLKIINPIVDKISPISNNIFIDSPVSIIDDFLKTELNLDGLMTFKENSGSYTPTDLDVGYISLYAKDKDLYVKYYDDTKDDPIITKNITAQVASFIRYLGGNNVYYNDGNVGIFAKNSPISHLNAQEKLHLGDGNLLLQRPPNYSGYNGFTPPGIIISESSTIKSYSDLSKVSFGFNYITSDISLPSSSSLKVENSSFDIEVENDFSITTKDKLTIEGEDEVSIYSKGNLFLQPSTDIDPSGLVEGSPQHGDLIIYDQTYDFIPSIVETSVGQIAIGHPEPKYWLDIRQMQHVADRQQYLDADGAVNIEPYMVNIQKGNDIQLELLKNTGQIINAKTFITGTSRVIDIKATEDNSYLTLIGSKKLGIDDNLPTQTFTGRGNLKLWGNKPTVYLGQEDSWIEDTDADGYMTNDFQQQTSSINFLGASETIFETGATSHDFPNYRHYGGISEIAFNNDLNETQFTPFNSLGSAVPTEDVIFNQYIDFRFLRILGVDEGEGASADPRLTKSIDLIDDDPDDVQQHKVTIDDSGGYFRAMIIDGRTESVGIGQHFKRGSVPIANAGQPTAKLDIQGNLNLTAELHEPGETIPASAIVLDDTQLVNALDAIDGVELTPLGTPATSDNNYGYGYYKGSMGEITIHTEHPDIFAEPPVGGDGYTDYTHEPWKSSSVNSNNLDIPSSLKDDGVNTWNEYGHEGGYKYDYIENVRISPLRDSFIKSHGNFGIGTVTPASRVHVTNSTLFLDGDSDLHIDFTPIDDTLAITHTTTIKSNNALEIRTIGTGDFDKDLSLISINDLNLNSTKNIIAETGNTFDVDFTSGNDFKITTSNKELVLTDTKIKFINLDDPTYFQTRGHLSSEYTTTDKLFDKNGITVELPDTSLPVMRFLPKIVRSGDTGGYVTINQEDPDPYGITVAFITQYGKSLVPPIDGTVITSPGDLSQHNTTSPQKVHVRTHANATGDLATTAENSVYILLEYESTQTIPPERWQEIYPEVLPVEGEKITLYNPNESFSEEFVIDTITFISNGVATYDGAIYVDKYNVVLTTQIGSNSDLISTDRIDDLKWDHSWDRQKYSQMTVDGFIADASSSGETLVTLDPTKQQQVYIKDKSGNGNHSVLWRNEVDDDVTLSTLSFTPVERDAILKDDNNLIRSQLELSTYHYDFQDVDGLGGGSNSNKSALIKRMEFFDSWNAPDDQFPNNEIIGDTDLPAEMSIYANTTIGTSSATNIDTHEGRKNLNIYGQLNLLQTGGTSNLNLDDTGNLTILGNLISTGGGADFNTNLAVGTDATIGGYTTIGDYATVGTYLNVTTDLDVGGEVTFDDDLFEINRGLNGTHIVNTEPTDIPLSGFFINRGQTVAEASQEFTFSLTNGSGYLNTGTLTYSFYKLSGFGNGSGFDIDPVIVTNTVDSLTVNDHGHGFERGDVWSIKQFDNAVEVSVTTEATFTIETTTARSKPAFVWSEGNSTSSDPLEISDQFVLLKDHTNYIYDLSNTQNATHLQQRDFGDFSAYIADFRANDIYAKTLYIPNHHGVNYTGFTVDQTETVATDYLKLEASAYELNKLADTFDTVGTNELNALHGLNISVLDYVTDNEYIGYEDGQVRTIQWQIDDLESRKVDMTPYFVNETTSTLIKDPKGLEPLADIPFYIRTNRNDYLTNFNNQYKDQFLAITKLNGYATDESNTALTDDFLGGALYYDSTTEVTSALDETYKSGDFIIGGYPYRPTTNHGEQQNTTVDGSGNPYIGAGQGTEFLNTNYDPRTHVFYAPDILLQPAKFGVYAENPGENQDTLETSGGNVGIGVEKANYQFHVEKIIHANATGEELNWNGSQNINTISGSNGEKLLTDDYYRPVVAFFGKNTFDINRRQPGLTGQPIQNGSVRLRISPRPDFVFDNTFGHERDTNVAEFELNAYEAVGIQQGSLGDFNIRNYFAKPTGTGGNINFITAKIPTIAGSEAIFEDGITASFGGLRTHGHMGIGGSPDLGSILKVYGKSSKGGGTSPDDASGSGFNSNTESLRLNSSIMFENPTFVNSSGETVPVQHKYFFLNDGGELQIADSISNLGEPSGISMEMRTTEIGVAKNIVPTFTAEFSRILKIDTHMLLSTPDSGRIFLEDNVGNTPVTIQPQDFSIVEVTDDPNTANQGHPTPPGYVRIRILTSEKATPVIKGSGLWIIPNNYLNEHKPFRPFYNVLDSYTDLADPTKHVIVIDYKPLTETQDGTPIDLPPVTDWKIGWDSVFPTGSSVSFTHKNNTYTNKVKHIAVGRQYDRDVAGGGNIIEISASVIITQDKIGTGELTTVLTVSEPTDDNGIAWFFNGVEYTSRLNLTQYDHFEFNQLSIPRPQLPSGKDYLTIEIAIMTPHTVLHNGTQSADNAHISANHFETSAGVPTLAFWDGRVNQNNSSNKGTYMWRRTWIDGVDDPLIKGENFEINDPWTKWEENVDYDIFDDYTDTETIDDFSNFNGYNHSSLNAHGLQKLGKTGGDVTSTLAGNGDLNLFIRLLPIDVDVGHNWKFLLFPEQSIFKSSVISIGTIENPVTELSTDGDSFHLGTSHLQDSRLNEGGFRIASSSLEMVAQADPLDTWTVPTTNTIPVEDIVTPYVGLKAPFDAGLLFVAKGFTSDEQEKLWYFNPRTGSQANDGSIIYSENYQAPMDILSGVGSADLSNIGENLIPSLTNNYNIGSEAFDPDEADPNNPLEIRAFKDVFIQGDYKYWNATTELFHTLNSATIPYHRSTLDIPSKTSNYTVDESFFTILEETFDSVYHKEFIRVRFDYDPYTGKEVSTKLDTDNIYETHEVDETKDLFTVGIIEEDIGFEIELTTEYEPDGEAKITQVLEILYSSPEFADVWSSTDQNGNSIDTTLKNHFLTNPEKIVLWSNIKLPQDFDHWDNVDPLSINLKAVDESQVKVTATIFDTNKTKTHEVIKNGNLTTTWDSYVISLEDALIPGAWVQGQEITLKLEIELKTPESAVDVSLVELKYDTRFEYTTLLPIINFTSTTTDTITKGITTLEETLYVNPSTHNHTQGGFTTVDPAIVVSGDIIPSVFETCSLGTVEHPFQSMAISDSTMYIGGQKSIAWGQNEQNNINYSAGSVGIGVLNPTVELDVLGDIKSSVKFIDPTGNSTQWNSAFSWGDHDQAGYEYLSNKGEAGGYASLDNNSKILTSQMPSLSLTDVSVVATQVLQLALTVEEGDVAVRTDESKSYIALNADNVDMGDWQELLAPPNLIQSVNSQTGVVVLDSDDVAEGTSNLYITDERVDERVSNLLVGGTGISLAYDNGANTLTINGSSLYTDEDAQDTIADFLIGGTGITLVEDDNANTLTINGSALYTNEDAQDTIADFLIGGTGITLVEDDNANTLTINGSALYTDENAMDAVAGMIQNGTGITWNYVDASNTLTPTITPVAGTITGDLNVVGAFSATTKSFDIEHPTKEGKRLIHGSLEGAEHGVYVRGKLEGNDEIELPDYWKELVDEDSITVQLTAIGKKQDLWVKDITNNRVFIGSSTNQVKCFYYIQAERKDVEKLIVEV